MFVFYLGRTMRISIHALHEESDADTTAHATASKTFQSTLSMRRATIRVAPMGAIHPISIHALHEESDLRMRITRCHGLISIHALHEESDRLGKIRFDDSQVFQSTLSMRRATIFYKTTANNFSISIHALHEESDISSDTGIVPVADFNPRSP